MNARDRFWKYLPIIVWFIAGIFAGVCLANMIYAESVRELTCLHRAATYPMNLSVKFASDVCGGAPLP